MCICEHICEVINMNAWLMGIHVHVCLCMGMGERIYMHVCVIVRWTLYLFLLVYFKEHVWFMCVMNVSDNKCI